MIVIKNDRLEVPTGTGTQVMPRTWDFDHEVSNCWVAMTGYRIGYTGGITM
jgi:hypothetical protein